MSPMLALRATLGHGQNHLAVAGGYEVKAVGHGCAPTRYREVVLTVPKSGAWLLRSANGRRIVKRVPLPASLSTEIVPLCASMMCLTSDKPSPLPFTSCTSPLPTR